MQLIIQSRSGREVIDGGLEVPAEASVDDLCNSFYKLKRKLYPSRQRFTLPPADGAKRGTPLVSGKRLKDYDLQDGSVLVFKDLGPQVGYTTVFFWEYVGPLLTYSFVYFFPQFVYLSYSFFPEKGVVQQTALRYWCFHYIKRIGETFLLHRFSHGTMPIFNLVRNCTYYWSFGAFVSYFVNHPLYTSPEPMYSLALFALAMVCQASNFRCHQILAELRPPGSKEYKIPRGFLFDYVTCANYTTEIIGWVAFTLATQTVAAAIFATCGALQMGQWALQKHVRLRKIFNGQDGKEKYPWRWIMLPPFF